MHEIQILCNDCNKLLATSKDNVLLHKIHKYIGPSVHKKQDCETHIYRMCFFCFVKEVATQLLEKQLIGIDVSINAKHDDPLYEVKRDLMFRREPLTPIKPTEPGKNYWCQDYKKERNQQIQKYNGIPWRVQVVLEIKKEIAQEMAGALTQVSESLPSEQRETIARQICIMNNMKKIGRDYMSTFINR